jgi:hypothetical protein
MLRGMLLSAYYNTFYGKSTRIADGCLVAAFESVEHLLHQNVISFETQCVPETGCSFKGLPVCINFSDKRPVYSQLN